MLKLTVWTDTPDGKNFACALAASPDTNGGHTFHNVALSFDLADFPMAVFQMVQREPNTLKDKSENWCHWS